MALDSNVVVHGVSNASDRIYLHVPWFGMFEPLFGLDCGHCIFKLREIDSHSKFRCKLDVY